MMSVRVISLRRLLGVVFSSLAFLAALSAVASMFLIERMQSASHELALSAESIWIAEEIETDLFRHNFEQDAAARAAIEADVQRKLERAGAYVSGDHERQVLDEVRRRTNAYFQGSRQGEGEQAQTRAPPALEAVVAASEALVAVNLSQSQAAAEHAERTHRMASYLGLALSAVILLAAAALLRFGQKLLAPVLAVVEALERFSAGERQVRVPESGPLELRRIAQRFNEMAEALDEQRRMQLAFLAGVAHDLRNPLSALRYSTALLGAERALPPEDKLRSMLALIGRQVDRLERMVGDLVDVTHVEAGQLDLQLGRHDVCRLIRAALELVEPSAAHRLELSVPERSVMVDCDPIRLEQILLNLVSNAFKYSPEGGVVNVALAESEGQAVLSVSDGGIGIAPADQQRVFDPFQRAAGARGAPGMGLGLFIVRRIVEAHRGRIEVESTPGRGSTFRVYLPLAAAPERDRSGLAWRAPTPEPG